MAESTALSREVTSPEHLFFRDQGERQDGDCGPAAVIGTIYYIYCKTGIKRAAFDLYSHMLVFVSMPRHTYSNKHYWLLPKSTTLRWKAVKRKFIGSRRICGHKLLAGIRAQIRMHPTLNGYATKLHNRNPQMTTDRQCGGRIWWWRSCSKQHYGTSRWTSAQALAAAQILRTTAGAGTLDLMLLNANHGVLILADTVLSQL